MNDPTVDTAGRIRWSLRRHAWVLIALMVAGPVTAVLLGGQAHTQYRASALVVAKSLALKQEQLPRFGEAVFTSGAVADAVASDMGIPTPPKGFIPNTISVVPMPDTVLFEVQAKAKSADTSTRIADIAAAAFVKELNKAGPGVGVFALQDPAHAPSKPLAPSVPTPMLALIGLLAAVIFGAGIVALSVSIGRPVVSAGEAASIVGAPLAASLTMGHGLDSPPTKKSGFARLAHGVFRARTEQCAVIASPGAQRAGGAVAVQLAEYANAPHVQANGSTAAARPLVMSGFELDDASDIPETFLQADHRVLVVMEGTPEKTLRASAQQFGPNQIDAVVLVSAKERRRDKKKPTAPVLPQPQPVPTDTGPVDAPLTRWKVR